LMDKSTERKIRVVIADDVAETRDSILKLLMFEKDMEVVGQAADGRQAIDVCRRLRPDVVLMDTNMPELDGIAATQEICSQQPGIAIIMLSIQAERDQIRRSMQAGARDFLVKPFTSDELVNAVRGCYEAESTRKWVGVAQGASEGSTDGMALPGTVISVFSPKGGVGRTTIITNLAIAMKTMTDKKVALVDCSLVFGDVGVFMNVISDKTISDVIPRIDELDAEYLDSIMTEHESGVKVLLAPPRPQLAELITGEHIRRLLAQLQRSFDYVLVDTWPAFQDVVLSILDLSDRIVLVTGLEMPSIKNVKLFLEVVELLGYREDKLVLVLNRADSKSGIRPEAVEEILRRKIAARIVSDGRSVPLSVNQGVPLVMTEKDKPFAKNIADLANVLIGSEGKAESATAEDATARKGALSRLIPAGGSSRLPKNGTGKEPARGLTRLFSR
jgi:pilus assembly protein CpaE